VPRPASRRCKVHVELPLAEIATHDDPTRGSLKEPLNAAAETNAFFSSSPISDSQANADLVADASSFALDFTPTS
jgi:hypothetical protein